MVGAPGHHADRQGVGGFRKRGQHAAVHQHAVAGRDLVQRDHEPSARLAGRGGAAPRFDRPGDAEAGGGPAAGRDAAVLRLHVEPGPGGGFLAGRAGHSGGVAQGRGPAAAAGRAERAPAGAGEPGGGRADQRVGDHRLRGGAGRGGGEEHRESAAVGPAVGCAGSAHGDVCDGRRFHGRRAVRRGADRPRLPRSERGGVGVVPGLCPPRRRDAEGLPAVRQGGRGRRPVDGQLAEDCSAPPDGHRHDQQRRVDRDQAGQRPAAGQRGGELRRPAAARR